MLPGSFGSVVVIPEPEPFARDLKLAILPQCSTRYLKKSSCLLLVVGSLVVGVQQPRSRQLHHHQILSECAVLLGCGSSSFEFGASEKVA